jgi:hypothetical protein
MSDKIRTSLLLKLTAAKKRLIDKDVNTIT